MEPTKNYSLFPNIFPGDLTGRTVYLKISSEEARKTTASEITSLKGTLINKIYEADLHIFSSFSKGPLPRNSCSLYCWKKRFKDKAPHDCVIWCQPIVLPHVPDQFPPLLSGRKFIVLAGEEDGEKLGIPAAKAVLKMGGQLESDPSKINEVEVLWDEQISFGLVHQLLANGPLSPVFRINMLWDLATLKIKEAEDNHRITLSMMDAKKKVKTEKGNVSEYGNKDTTSKSSSRHLHSSSREEMPVKLFHGVSRASTGQVSSSASDVLSTKSPKTVESQNAQQMKSKVRPGKRPKPENLVPNNENLAILPETIPQNRPSLELANKVTPPPAKRTKKVSRSSSKSPHVDTPSATTSASPFLLPGNSTVPRESSGPRFDSSVLHPKSPSTIAYLIAQQMQSKVRSAKRLVPINLVSSNENLAILPQQAPQKTPVLALANKVTPPPEKTTKKSARASTETSPMPSATTRASPFKFPSKLKSSFAPPKSNNTPKRKAGQKSKRKSEDSASSDSSENGIINPPPVYDSDSAYKTHSQRKKSYSAFTYQTGGNRKLNSHRNQGLGDPGSEPKDNPCCTAEEDVLIIPNSESATGLQENGILSSENYQIHPQDVTSVVVAESTDHVELPPVAAGTIISQFQINWGTSAAVQQDTGLEEETGLPFMNGQERNCWIFKNRMEQIIYCHLENLFTELQVPIISNKDFVRAPKNENTLKTRSTFFRRSEEGMGYLGLAVFENVQDKGGWQIMMKRKIQTFLQALHFNPTITTDCNETTYFWINMGSSVNEIAAKVSTKVMEGQCNGKLTFFSEIFDSVERKDELGCQFFKPVVGTVCGKDSTLDCKCTKNLNDKVSRVTVKTLRNLPNEVPIVLQCGASTGGSSTLNVYVNGIWTKKVLQRPDQVDFEKELAERDKNLLPSSCNNFFYCGACISKTKPEIVTNNAKAVGRLEVNFIGKCSFRECVSRRDLYILRRKME